MTFFIKSFFFLFLFFSLCVVRPLLGDGQAEYLARRNALAGLETAVGEIQKHLGADQRISVPATTVYPEKDVTQGIGPLYDDGNFGFRSHAQVSRMRTYLNLERGGTYLTPQERGRWDEDLVTWWSVGIWATTGGERRNPHWVGVFDSSLRVDRATDPDHPMLLPRQSYEDHPGETLYGEFFRKQLPVWLVSGNETFENFDPTDSSYPPGYLTPDQPLASQGIDPKDVVRIFDPGQPSYNPPALDGTVEVARQPLGSDGHYAYWVADESVKANFAVQDLYQDAPQGSTESTWRLSAPQGTGWEHMAGFEAARAAGLPDALGDLPTKLYATDQFGRAHGLLTAPVAANFHHLTPHSVGLFTDTALGGLKKDLTRFLEDDQGLNPTDTIPDFNKYDPSDPRFRAWGGTNSGFPDGGPDGLPTWGQISNWYQNTGSLSPDAETAPVPTYFKMHMGLSYDPGNKELHWHWAPAIVLWNPYDVPLDNATYTIEIEVSPVISQFNVVNTHPSLAELQQDSDAEWEYRSMGQGGESVLSFKSWIENPEYSGITYPYPYGPPVVSPFRYNWPAVSSNPDDYNIGGEGPFPYDDDFGDGTTDAFGRFYYNLRQLSGMADRTTDPFIDRDPSNPDGWYLDDKDSAVGPKGWRGMRFQPMTSDPDNQVIDTVLKFRITTSFAPGESRIFSMSGPENWNPNDTQAVDLDDGFDPDFPGTVHFPVAKVVNGPSSADNLRFFFETLPQSRVTPRLRLLVDGDLSFKTESFGGSNRTNLELMGHQMRPYDFFWRNEDADGDNILNNNESHPKFIDRWRPLYATDDFHDHIQPYVNDTGATDSPIFDWGEHYLTPLTAKGDGSKDDVHRNYAVFSRYNLFAQEFDSFPLLDRIRNVNGVNNRNYLGDPEGLVAFSLFNSTSFWAPSKWDNDQYDRDNGFSLVTWQDRPGQTYEGLSELPVRLSRRPDSNLLSIGQLQQVNLSPYVWQPAFPIGNSWAGIYNDREAIAGIHSREPGVRFDWYDGNTPRLPQVLPNSMSFSFSGESRFGADLGTVDVPANSLLDMSYVLNENIWDRYFLSSISSNPDLNDPLPNGRHRYASSVLESSDELTDFDLASAHLRNHGALNVNSTSVEAWKALLTAFRDLELANTPPETVPVPRTLDPIGDAIEFTFDGIDDHQIGAVSSGKDYSELFNGIRYLTDDMIQALAERIVDEVRLRGPFYSVADFVNRRLVAPEGSHEEGSPWFEARTTGWEPGGPNVGSNTRLDYMNPTYDPFIGLQGLTGALQRAIDVSGINGGVNHPVFDHDGSDSGNDEDRVFTPRIRNTGDASATGSSATDEMTSAGIGGYSNTSSKHFTEPTLRSHVDTEHHAGAPAGEAGQLFQGVPGTITQGDLLTMIGPALTARGDTFMIRAYGDAIDPDTGLTLATARLEAVVQRIPDPLEPATANADGIPAKWIPATSDGRKFTLIGFRWLAPDEK